MTNPIQNTSQPRERTRIKICGVRRLEDALFAAEAGADAIGMVFHPPSPRNVAMDVALRIVDSLPPFVTPIMLMVDPTPDQVATVCDVLGANNVQLHGKETPGMLRAIRGRLLKAIRADRATFEAELTNWATEISIGGLDHLCGLVLETAGPGIGGTGHANDWAFIRQVADQGGFARLPPIIAAGGLTPENVASVIRQIRPYAVDVSSGVEKMKGEKSPELITKFIAAVREADAENH